MDKWEKLNKRLEEYDKLFGEQERKEQQELKEWSKKFRQKNQISLQDGSTWIHDSEPSLRVNTEAGHPELFSDTWPNL